MPTGFVTQLFLGSGGVVNSGEGIDASGYLGAIPYLASGEIPQWLSASGKAGYVLQADASGFPVWASGIVSGSFAASGFANPMSTSGDMIYGQAAGAAARLSGGANGYVMQWWSGIPQWVSGVMSGWIDPSVFPFRLTLASGDACPAWEVSGSANLHLACAWQRSGMAASGVPFATLFNGSGFQQYQFSGVIPQLTLALSVASGSVYDVFVYPNAGAPALELGVAWTNTTTRASGLVYRQGIPLAAWDLTRRYVGTIAGTVANASDDRLEKRFCANWNNPITRPLFTCPGYVDDNNYTSYTTTSTTFVSANGGTGSKLQFISLGTYATDYSATGTANHGTGNGLAFLGVGEDSTTTPKVSIFGQAYGAGANFPLGGIGKNTLFSVGYHYLDLLITTNTGTATYYADFARLGGSADPYATFLKATVMG